MELHVTFQVPRIWMWLLHSWKICIVMTDHLQSVGLAIINTFVLTNTARNSLTITSVTFQINLGKEKRHIVTRPCLVDDMQF